MTTGGYWSIQEWIQAGINISHYLDKEAQHARLKELGLPSLDRITIAGNDAAGSARPTIQAFFKKHAPLVLVSVPQSAGLPKHHKVPAHTIDDYDAFITEVAQSILGTTNGLQCYDILLTEMVEGMQENFTGIAESDGQGTVLLECSIRPFWWDIRELSSGRSRASDLFILRYDYDGLIAANRTDISIAQRWFNDIARQVSHYRGYFEFIHGIKGGTRGTYFMEYQSSSAFINVLPTLQAIPPTLRERMNARLREEFF